ncbi:uncharacterized protein METZ01_LOCUS3853 [marine metagenome]|uniref:Uncharacterized protein n=1 Tax=marine metagenome TaxID=408172 RepID=A0A381N966_9ZZZZ
MGQSGASITGGRFWYGLPLGLGYLQPKGHSLHSAVALFYWWKKYTNNFLSKWFLLGHSSFTITLDTYSHVLPNMQDQLAGGCGQPSEAVVEISTIVEIGYCVLLYTSLPVGNNGTAGPF